MWNISLSFANIPENRWNTFEHKLSPRSARLKTSVPKVHGSVIFILCLHSVLFCCDWIPRVSAASQNITINSSRRSDSGSRIVRGMVGFRACAKLRPSDGFAASKAPEAFAIVFCGHEHSNLEEPAMLVFPAQVNCPHSFAHPSSEVARRFLASLAWRAGWRYKWLEQARAKSSHVARNSCLLLSLFCVLLVSSKASWIREGHWKIHLNFNKRGLFNFDSDTSFFHCSRKFPQLTLPTIDQNEYLVTFCQLICFHAWNGPLDVKLLNIKFAW